MCGETREALLAWIEAEEAGAERRLIPAWCTTPCRAVQSHRYNRTPRRTIVMCVALSSGVTEICASGRSTMLPFER